MKLDTRAGRLTTSYWSRATLHSETDSCPSRRVPSLPKPRSPNRLLVMADRASQGPIGTKANQSLGIEMFLTNLLTSRTDFKATAVPAIQNNLIVERTARDQVRLNGDFHFAHLNVYAEGRLRFRTLVQAGEDPQFVIDQAKKNQVAANFAWDATVGAREQGSLFGIRFGLFYTLLDDYRSTSHVAGLEMGRDFWSERISMDFAFLNAKTRDQAVGSVACAANAPTISTAPDASALGNACFGTRDGQSFEPNLTLSIRPSKHWFVLGDYRLVVNQTERAPVIYTHIALLRLKTRY